METRANHVIVGLFVLLLGLGGLGFAAWVAALKADRESDNYLLLFEGAVTGLSVGSSVNYEGVPVGEVIAINLDDQDPGRVRVIIEIDAETPVRSDTTATLEIAGLTGGRYVQLAGGSRIAGPPQAEGEESLPQLPTKQSPLEQVLAGAPDAVTAVNNLLIRAEKILSDQNAERISTILDESAETMANLSDTSAIVADMAGEFRSETRELGPQMRRTLRSIEDLAAGLEQAGQEAQPTVVEVREAAASFRRLADDLNVVVEENRRPLADFTTSGLSELSALLAELRRLSANLSQITRDLQTNPAGFFLGVSPDGYRPSDD